MPRDDESVSPVLKILIAISLIGSIGAILYFSFWQSPSPSVYAPNYRPEMGRHVDNPRSN